MTNIREATCTVRGLAQMRALAFTCILKEVFSKNVCTHEEVGLKRLGNYLSTVFFNLNGVMISIEIFEIRTIVRKIN